MLSLLHLKDNSDSSFGLILQGKADGSLVPLIWNPAAWIVMLERTVFSESGFSG